MEELATGYGLIEGPVWDNERGLIYSDAMNGGVRAIDPSSGTITEIVPKRRGIGGIVPHAEGGLVIGGREIIYESFDRKRSATLWARKSLMSLLASTISQLITRAAFGSAPSPSGSSQTKTCAPAICTLSIWTDQCGQSLMASF